MKKLQYFYSCDFELPNIGLSYACVTIVLYVLVRLCIPHYIICTVEYGASLFSYKNQSLIAIGVF